MDEIFLRLCQHNPVITLVTLIGLAAAVIAWLRRDRRLDSIPGPRGKYPFIGIGFHLPPKAPVLFRQWAQTYGDIFKIRVGYYNWVVINSPEAIREILEKQSLATSSKPPSPMGHDVVTGRNRMPTMSYGPRWRALRTMVRQITTVPMTASFIPSQEFEAKQLLSDLATANADQRAFYQHTRRFAFSIVMTNTFGTRVKCWDHPAAQGAVRTQAILRATSRPGAFVVDDIPLLARLPRWLQPGRRAAEQAAKQVLDIKMAVWRRLGKEVEAGTAPHCYARDIFAAREAWGAQGLDEAQLAWVATGIVEAGFETTAATLNGLVLRLAGDRRVQDAAQAELMRVVGPGRLPTLADARDLPYVRACVKEMLRLNPILSPGIRHYADEDVVYKGHVIPKGTVLVANTAFLHFDERRFENPFQFVPERYLGHGLYSSEYAAMSDPYKRDHFTFSTGRRTCPGARLAENSLIIALAGILWAFEIRPPLNEDGVEQEMDLSDNAFPDAGFLLPKPFAARFIPRGEGRAAIVRDAWEAAMRDGYELRGVPVDVDGMVQQF